MYQVSEAYKEQIRKSLRNYSFIKIVFGLTDPDADAHAVVSNNGQLDWSTNPEIEDLHTVSSTYATLELNRWLLNGSQKLLPDKAPYMYQAFVSDKQSSAQGALEVAAELTVNFTEGSYSFSGLSFTFDSITGDFPSEMAVRGYLDNQLVYTDTAVINTVNFEYNKRIPGTEGFVNKLIISFTQTNLPNRRVRVEDVILGLRRIITEDTLTDSSWKRSNDLMNTILPDESFMFTFLDPDKDYNPDNPQGLWEYIETGQQVQFSYGYQLDNETIEWIPGSRYLTDGSVNIVNGNSLPEVTFNTVSQIQALTDVYEQGVYSASGATLYALADGLLQWAGVVDAYGNKKYILDDTLKNFVTTAPLPMLPVNQLLQIIANEGMCLLFTDRNGYTNIAPRKTSASGFAFTFNDVKDTAPDTSKYPFLKNLSVKFSMVQPAAEASELASLEVAGVANETIEIEYDAATSLEASASSGLVINEIVGLYARKAIVKVTGTGKLTITGNPLEFTDYVMNKQFNVAGEDCALTTQLIQDRQQVSDYLDWMGATLTKRSVYSFSERGFPEIDVTDIISVDTAYTEGKSVNLTSSTITYNGGLSGESEVLG